MPSRTHLIIRVSDKENKMLAYLSKRTGLRISDIVRQLILREYREEKKRDK